jgi:phosphonate transport system substrate-binding protein
VRLSAFLLAWASLLPCAGMARASGAPPPAPLRLAVMPYDTPEALVREFQPLVRYLQRTLGRPVEISTAPNYAELMRRIIAGEADLAQLAPHLGLIAIERGGWTPLTRDTGANQPVVVVLAQGPIHTLADLRGKKVGLPDPVALISLMSERQFARLDAASGPPVSYVHVPNHPSVMHLVLQGLADGGVVAVSMLTREPSEVRGQLREVVRLKPAFGLVFVAAPGLGPGLQDRIRAALIAISGDEEGRKFFTREPLLRYVPLSAADMRPFAPESRMALERLKLASRP